MAEPGMRHICPACNALYERTVFVCERCGTGLLEIPDAPLLSGSVLDGRYDIEGVVGAGGMGTVYRARQRGMEREVAVKVLHAHFAHEPRAVKRFFREAQAASRLIHPNIVSVFDFGRSTEGQLYMVMEILEGQTLGDLIHYRAPLASGLAIAIAAQVCDALEEAHRTRLVHRDLKPDNILLTTVEEGLWAKVLDFGIARIVRDPSDSEAMSRNHSTVEIAGTPAYMSPEQILGKEPDPRSDLYSLGIIVYEMLTRHRPFEDENSVTLCMRQLNEEPPRVGVHAAVSEPLEKLVRALLAKNPADRPQRARDVKMLLQACPEAGLPFSLPSLDGGAGGIGGRGVAERTTRADASLLMAERTMDLGSLPNQHPPLAEVIERFRKAATEGLGNGLVFPAKAGGGLGRAASEAAGSGRPDPKSGKDAKKKVALVVVIAAEHTGAFAHADVAAWLRARESAGWDFAKEDRRLVAKIAGEGDAHAQVRDVTAELGALQERALAGNIGLRVGVASVEDQQLAAALDLARRLAVATTHGQVAVSNRLASRAELAVRPQTTVFMPDGSPLECAVLRRAPRPAATTDAQDEDAPGVGGLLWGRGLQLRRLGQIGDEALRTGPTTALVVGARGTGKSACLAAFLGGRNAVSLRVSPAAQAYPGHAIARLIGACYGVQTLRGRPSDLDPLVEFDLDDRARELLELVLLDRPVVEPPSLRSLARLTFDALCRKATTAGSDGALVIAIDDAHALDRASREVLVEVLKLAAGKPWCFVGSARTLKTDTWLFEAPRIELRPLGLRAMNQLAEGLRIPPRPRHALLAAAQGNPLALRLLAELSAAQGDAGSLPSGLAAGDALVPWLLGQVLRAATPQAADRAWLQAALGEGGLGEEPLTQAARLYLETALPKEHAVWLVERLHREGPVPDALASQFREPSPSEAARRAGRAERLGLYRLAAIEVEMGLALATTTDRADRGARELEVAVLRARGGDVKGALQSYDASARTGGDRRPTALLRFARTLLALGENDRADQALDAASKTLETTPAASMSHHMIGEWWVLKGRASLLRRDIPGAANALQRAREVSEALARTDARNARSLQALVQEVRAEVAVATADREAARTNFRQARDAFRDLGAHADALRCLVALGEVELGCRDLRRAADTFRAASRLAGAAGLYREELAAEVGLGESELALGELDEGTQRLRQAFRRAGADDEDGTLQARTALGMARAMAARRLWADVSRYAERARSATRSPAIAARAFEVEADAWLGQDQARKAHRALEQALEQARTAADGILAETLEARLRVRPATGQAPVVAAMTA